VPAWAREPVHVDALEQSWKRVLEEQLCEYFTVAELAALARFYAMPEGLSGMRKMLAVNAAVVPMLEAEVTAWARRVRSSAAAGEGTGSDPAQHRAP